MATMLATYKYSNAILSTTYIIQKEVRSALVAAVRLEDLRTRLKAFSSPAFKWCWSVKVRKWMYPSACDHKFEKKNTEVKT